MSRSSERSARRGRFEDHFFAIPWRHVAISASLLVVALLVGSGIALGVNDLDALTTTALVLAVIAFVTQLIMFIATSWTSSQQMLQSQSLNSETSRLLNDTRNTLQEMSAIAGERFDRVLDRALGDTREAVAESVVGAAPRQR